VKEPEEILGLGFPAVEEAAEAHEPGEEPFNLPALFVATKRAAVLAAGFALAANAGASLAYGADQVDAVLGQLRLKNRAVVGLVADEEFGKASNETGFERLLYQSGFVSRSIRD